MKCEWIKIGLLMSLLISPFKIEIDGQAGVISTHFSTLSSNIFLKHLFKRAKGGKIYEPEFQVREKASFAKALSDGRSEQNFSILLVNSEAKRSIDKLKFKLFFIKLNAKGCK